VTDGRIEAELKYWATDERPLHSLAAAATLGRAELGPAHTQDEIDRYLDTADLRLAAVYWACRLRSREGRTLVSLKGPAEHTVGATLHRRPELEGPATPEPDPAAWPPSAARARLLEMTGGEPLVERLALAQRRTERGVRERGLPTGVLSLDRVRVLRDGAEIGRLLTVELELDPDALAGGLDPHQLAAALEAIHGLRPDPLTKLEHALQMASGARR
jgi:inorganic triphosphatase YgiF